MKQNKLMPYIDENERRKSQEVSCWTVGYYEENGLEDFIIKMLQGFYNNYGVR